MRDNIIKTACVIGLLTWSAGTFAEETSTSIIEVGEPAPQLMPQYGTTSSRITFENQGQTLVGILTEPLMDSPYPIVVMAHGFSGNKDGLSVPVKGTEETMYGRTARVFAEQGIANLRFDYRGSGESDGDFADMRFTRQISDALVAIEYAANLPQIDPERMGLLGLSQGGVIAPSAAARDDRIDSMVLWSPVAIPYATYTMDVLGPDTIETELDLEGAGLTFVEAGLNLDDGESLSFTFSGRTLELKRPFFEELLKVDPVAEIVRFTKPLMVVVGLQDVGIKPQPQMGEIYMRYHEGEEALIILDAGHVFNMLEGPEELDKAIAWSTDWFTKTLIEEEHHEESEGFEGFERFFDRFGFDLRGFCERHPKGPFCESLFAN
ncbi:alpha/beta hydrolase [Candidatus Thiosymbion oneisti]|uniref:alpha/beta hydrolase n=1 Tax=Candidatus Thiosymbion oneisti TaxID=589554 RepID=UPI00105DDEB9|nr:alpha/beta fold hydrolase [Candidatus Thiosymbion oneisti]